MGLFHEKDDDDHSLGLSRRHKIEEEFHDIKAREVVHDFYELGALSFADSFLWSSLGDLREKRLLEIGCGDGEATLRFAKAGAVVTAIDISRGMLELTRKKVDQAGVGMRVTTIQMGGEVLDFPEGSFDLVYGHSILHHLNLDIASQRVARLLKSGGVGAFLEPLNYNPVLNAFRYLTPQRRTATERPVEFDQLKNMANHFSGWEHQEFYLFSLIAFFWYYIIENKSFFQNTLRALSSFDRFIFKSIPFSRKFAWVTVIRYIK
jgi:SAM-dependent methyltransferase